jgi:hypothetical protein
MKCVVFQTGREWIEWQREGPERGRRRKGYARTPVTKAKVTQSLVDVTRRIDNRCPSCISIGNMK